MDLPIDSPELMLETGKRLGPYEIVSPIGAGGMGEVYKARDSRLERSVAIKVLPVRIGICIVGTERVDGIAADENPIARLGEGSPG